ncbi:MAG: TspO/MBR family protein [Chitinophagales bacterium]|nr:TspO/MBR family protein [Chitinophagales bacterium]
MRPIWKIIIAVAVCLSVGGLSGFATSGAIEGWYNTLNKPSFNPPNWVFGPAWTILYILMGIAAGLVWNAGWHKAEVRKALGIFAVQLLLNGLWSIIFFSLQSPTAALIDIVLMLALIVLTMVRFKPIDSRAAYLLIPYVLWVSFATVLNTSIIILN